MLECCSKLNYAFRKLAAAVAIFVLSLSGSSGCVVLSSYWSVVVDCEIHFLALTFSRLFNVLYPTVLGWGNLWRQARRLHDLGKSGFSISYGASAFVWARTEAGQ